MNLTAVVDEMEDFSFHETILRQGELISDKLNMLRIEHYPPDALKGLRQFSLAEVAYFLGVTQSNIKKLHLDGKGPVPTTSVSGRRTYTARQMLELRRGSPALRLGTFERVEADATLLVFRRCVAGDVLLCGFNFGTVPRPFAASGQILAGATRDGFLDPNGYVVMSIRHGAALS